MQSLASVPDTFFQRPNLQVPEPGSLLLLAAGFGAAGWFGRRRDKRALRTTNRCFQGRLRAPLLFLRYGAAYRSRLSPYLQLLYATACSRKVYPQHTDLKWLNIRQRDGTAIALHSGALLLRKTIAAAVDHWPGEGN